MNPQAEIRPVVALPVRDPGAAAPGYYRWEAADQPLSVKLSLRAVEEILQDALLGFGFLPRRGAEVGGLLLGAVEESAGRRAVAIHGFESIACEYAFGPSYVLSPRSEAFLLEALARRRHSGEPDRQVVGFYRSHTRKGLFLSPHDVVFLKKFFPETASVFLLVKPYLTRTSEAGFFLWDSVRRDPETPAHEFPFSREHLEKKTVRAEPGWGNGRGTGASGVTPFPLELPSNGRRNGPETKPRVKSSYARALRYLEFVDQEIREAAQKEDRSGDLPAGPLPVASPCGAGAPWIQDILADSLASLRKRAMLPVSPPDTDASPSVASAPPPLPYAAPAIENSDLPATEPLHTTPEVAPPQQSDTPEAIPSQPAVSSAPRLDRQDPAIAEPARARLSAGSVVDAGGAEHATSAEEEKQRSFLPLPGPPDLLFPEPEVLAGLLPVKDLLAVAQAAAEPPGRETSTAVQGEMRGGAAVLSPQVHLAKPGPPVEPLESGATADAAAVAPGIRKTDPAQTGNAELAPAIREECQSDHSSPSIVGVSATGGDPLREHRAPLASVYPAAAIALPAVLHPTPAILPRNAAAKGEPAASAPLETEAPAATPLRADPGAADPVAPLLQLLAEVTASRDGRNPQGQAAVAPLAFSDKRLWCFRGKWLPLILLVALSGAVLGYFTGKSSGAEAQHKTGHQFEQEAQMRTPQLTSRALPAFLPGWKCPQAGFFQDEPPVE